MGEVAGVIVLGAGRSGTSAITRALVASGFFAGSEEELLGATPSNPVGHYEGLAVLELNEELLDRLGYWAGDAPKPEELHPLRDEVGVRIEAILSALAGRAGRAPIVVKEPRINGLLPLWGPVIDGVLHPVLAVRDPLMRGSPHNRLLPRRSSVMPRLISLRSGEGGSVPARPARRCEPTCAGRKPVRCRTAIT